MAPGNGGEPTGALAAAIRGQLGGYEKLKDDFSKAAMTRFGSGWAWLSAGADGKLLIESTANQDSPLMHGNKPLLGIDVWEHAYYLHYQNRRADYVAAFFNVIDWDVIGQRFASLRAVEANGSLACLKKQIANPKRGGGASTPACPSCLFAADGSLLGPSSETCG